MNQLPKTISVPRVALYARVSSEHQAQEQTIASQVLALRERIAADGLTLDEEFCFLDDGVSGATLARPALERLRDMAYAGGFQKLYVHSPDRLARRYAYQVLLVDELRRHSVEIVFLNRAIGVSPEEDLLLQMQGMFAEYERAKILERSRRGKRYAAQRGVVNVLCGGGPGSTERIQAELAVSADLLSTRAAAGSPEESRRAPSKNSLALSAAHEGNAFEQVHVLLVFEKCAGERRDQLAAVSFA